MSLSNIICSAGASTCISRETSQIVPGYYCRRGICHTCSSGFYSVDGRECENCPTGTSSIHGSSSCSSLLKFTRPGIEQIYIPFGSNKIRAYLQEGGACGSEISDGGEYDQLSSNCGVFSSCIMSVPMNSSLYVIVGGSDQPDSSSRHDNYEGGKGISAIQLVKGLDAFATAGFSDDYSPSRGCDPMTYETFKDMNSRYLDYNLYGKGFSRDSEQTGRMLHRSHGQVMIEILPETPRTSYDLETAHVSGPGSFNALAQPPPPVTITCVNKPYCYASDTRLVSTGYACVNKICELCPSGTFSNDGISCRTCPYATSSIPGSKTCGSTIRFTAFGSFSTYIPYGISKINVRLWGGGGGGDANALQENVSWNGISTSLDPRAGGGGGFSACNITVIQNTFVRVIVGGGGKDSFGFTDFTGGYGGGGSGKHVFGYKAGGGGGRSCIQIVNGTDVVTAGGGGGGADCLSTDSCGGGGGGGLAGTKCNDLHCGFPGTDSAGGLSGQLPISNLYCRGQSGSKYRGGDGCQYQTTFSTAGGGGGYYGGGGGLAARVSAGGGGGGSSYGGGCDPGTFVTYTGAIGGSYRSNVIAASGGASQPDYVSGVGIGGMGVKSGYKCFPGGPGAVFIRFLDPARNPTGQPTGQPSARPSGRPTGRPSRKPVIRITVKPTNAPSRQPTDEPSKKPLQNPTAMPIGNPSDQPTPGPTPNPTGSPSFTLTSAPTSEPTLSPTAMPILSPTAVPLLSPTAVPIGNPSNQPTPGPTPNPTGRPSFTLTSTPTFTLTGAPTSKPTLSPTARAITASPSFRLTGDPPIFIPIAKPTASPTFELTEQPTDTPTLNPTVKPTVKPSSTSKPTNKPIVRTPRPTGSPIPKLTPQPTGQPSIYSKLPSFPPSDEPSLSSQPSNSPPVRSEPPSESPSNELSFLPTATTILPTTPSKEVFSSKPSSAPTVSPQLSVQPSTPRPTSIVKSVFTSPPTVNKEWFGSSLPTPFAFSAAPSEIRGSVCVVCSIFCLVNATAWKSTGAQQPIKGAIASALNVSPGDIDIDSKGNLCQQPASSAPSASALPRSFSEILLKEHLTYPQSLSGKEREGNALDFFFSNHALQAITDPNEISFSVRTVLPVASSATSIDVVSNATRKDLVSAMASGVFCNNIADSMLKSNVTGLSSPDQISAIRAICKSTTPRVAFVSNVVPTAYRPSSSPTSRPLPYRGFKSTDTTKHLVTVPFLGYMFIILLLGCLRCAPCLFGCGTLGKDEGSPHLYDILVILNDEEEAIFENIRHEDITFFRSTLSNPGEPSLWVMNLGPDAIEKRTEVQFYDRFDLIGEGNHTDSSSEVGKAAPIDHEYLHDAEIVVGMIINVKSRKLHLKDGTSTAATSPSFASPNLFQSPWSKPKRPPTPKPVNLRRRVSVPESGAGSGSSPRRSSSAFIPQRRSSISDYPLPTPSPVILNSTIRPFRSGKDIVRSIPIFLSEEASGEESRHRDRIGPPKQKRVLPPLDLNFERPRSGMKSRDAFPRPESIGKGSTWPFYTSKSKNTSPSFSSPKAYDDSYVVNQQSKRFSDSNGYDSDSDSDSSIDSYDEGGRYGDEDGYNRDIES